MTDRVESYKPLLLVEALPQIAEEIRARAEQIISEGGPGQVEEHRYGAGHTARTLGRLASILDQLPRLRIHGRCACGDDFCSSIYVTEDGGPIGPPTRGRTAIPLIGEALILRLEPDGRVHEVEMLFRKDGIKEKLDALGIPNTRLGQ